MGIAPMRLWRWEWRWR